MTMTPRTRPLGGLDATVTCQGGYVGGNRVLGPQGADTRNRSWFPLPAALGMGALATFVVHPVPRHAPIAPLAVGRLANRTPP
jgi:hypothetical protein